MRLTEITLYLTGSAGLIVAVLLGLNLWRSYGWSGFLGRLMIWEIAIGAIGALAFAVIFTDPARREMLYNLYYLLLIGWLLTCLVIGIIVFAIGYWLRRTEAGT